MISYMNKIDSKEYNPWVFYSTLLHYSLQFLSTNKAATKKSWTPSFKTHVLPQTHDMTSHTLESGLRRLKYNRDIHAWVAAVYLAQSLRRDARLSVILHIRPPTIHVHAQVESRVSYRIVVKGAPLLNHQQINRSLCSNRNENLSCCPHHHHVQMYKYHPAASFQSSRVKKQPLAW